MAENRPIKKFSAGTISLSIFQNAGKGRNGEAVTFRSSVLQRRYKDKSGNWQSTNNFRTEDLPKVRAVVEEAFNFLVLRDVEATSEASAEEGMIEEVI